MIKSIAIDGPAGAGKSTIAKILSAKKGFIYVDTGAMYRAIGLYFYRLGINGTDTVRILEHLDEIEVSIDYLDGHQVVFLNGENVNDKIRESAISKMASEVSAVKEVRERMVAIQQEMAKTRSVVMDGRDIGTVVLPNALVKIFLTASVDVRAKRRFDEYIEKGITDKSIEELRKEISERDYNDTHRKNSPLMKADDAVEVDTSELSITEVVECIDKIAVSRGL